MKIERKERKEAKENNDVGREKESDKSRAKSWTRGWKSTKKKKKEN